MLNIVTLTLAAVPVLLIWIYVRNRVLSPLQNIPGPFLASLTAQYLVFFDLAGRRTDTIHQWHRKYGPVVRVGPREVSFSDPESFNEIYSQQTNYIKGEQYETMSVKPFGIFSLREKSAHSTRRALLSHAFSQANIYACAPVIHGHVEKLVRKIGDQSSKPTNALLFFRLFSLDVVGELFLGLSFDGLDHDEPPQFLHDMDQLFLLGGIQWNFPLIYRILTVLPFASLRHFMQSTDRIMEYGDKCYRRYIEQYGRDPSRKDLLSKILTKRALTDRETYVEVANLVFAGTDTTSTTLTYLFWELTRHPEWQQHVREELSKLALDTDSPRFLTGTEAPIMEAVINEGLRLHPAAPASLPRSTPRGGASLASYYIPQDTVVSAQCYTTQRDPTVFPDPDTFNPQRWLDGQPTEQMKDLFMPFSKGTRACLGRPLAMMELRQCTAALLQKYRVSAAPETTADSMEMRDHFLVIPKAERCDLIFEAL